MQIITDGCFTIDKTINFHTLQRKEFVIFGAPFPVEVGAKCADQTLTLLPGRSLTLREAILCQ